MFLKNLFKFQKNNFRRVFFKKHFFNFKKVFFKSFKLSDFFEIAALKFKKTIFEF